LGLGIGHADNATDLTKVKRMESNEEIYLNALKKIKILTLDFSENFDGDKNDISHFLGNLYEVLDEANIMMSYFE
jgi:hypothetical protein